MKKILPILVSILVISGCTASPKKHKQYSSIDERSSEIVTSGVAQLQKEQVRQVLRPRLQLNQQVRRQALQNQLHLQLQPVNQHHQAHQ